MFPEREIKCPKPPEPLTVYRGYKFTIGIRLVVDKIWLYRLQQTEILTVEIRDNNNNIKIIKDYTADDVDTDDAIITVNFDESDTLKLSEGDNYISASVDGYMIMPPQKINVKEVAENAGKML